MSMSSRQRERLSYELARSQVIAHAQHAIRCQRIEHGTRVAPALYEAGLKEHLQVFRRSRLPRIRGVGDLPDGLFSSTEHRQDTDAGRIGEGAAAVRDHLQLFV